MKRVVLGVTGSIAAYKACDIVSRLKKRGVDVCVILTRAATEFITPLAIESLTHTRVETDMFSRETPAEVAHIALAQRADCFLIAPASANFLAKAAVGIADDMLTTTLLATRAPIYIAPAMNAQMYLHPQVQENIARLKARGCRFIEPESGLLACGDTGIGRLADTEHITDMVMAALEGEEKRDLSGKKILVSAGPTQEKIDPVRYITNRSSGKMGYAIAEAAAQRGAAVTLISGPVALPCPQGVERVEVRSSADMLAALDTRFDDCDALIMAAAPADFTPHTVQTQKIKKNANGDGLSLELKPTADILQTLGRRKREQRIMGFAAETESLESNALGKLEKKNLDMIAANDVGAENTGFGVDTNAVTLYMRGGSAQTSGLMRKRELADWLLDRLF